MEWTPITLPAPNPFQGRGERSAGVHLTEIIAFIEQRIPLLVKNKGQAGAEPDYSGWELAGTTGFAFEDAMADALSRFYESDLVRGMEINRDGIAMSPDGVDLDRWELYEFKMSWKSMRTSPPHEVWKWLVQIMGYLRELGPNVDGEFVCNLVAFYACGDYRPPAPKLVPVRMVFTEEEIENNWAMVRGARDMMKAEGLIL